MIMDRYFRMPIFWDLVCATLIVITTYGIQFKFQFKYPKLDLLLSLTTDLSSISLTLSGFILTLLTVLITFKSSNNTDVKIDIENQSVFNLFFYSKLYFQTVSILKNCIKILVLIAITGYTLKLFVETIKIDHFFYFNEFSLVVLLLTIFRCLFILVKIIEMQEDK